MKQTGTGQAWFPRNWTRGNRHVKDGIAVFGMWKGVRVGVIRTNGKIGTIFPDSKQPYKCKKKGKGK